MKKNVSGLIITFNEEENIREVLQCMDFCKEIIIVDSYSTDQTLQIATEFPNVKIVKNKFEDFTKQRNLALEHASYDWILFLDADERITPQLKKEILRELDKPNAKDAYYFYRQFFFEKKAIHFSGTQNDKNFRLFRKSKAHYIEDKKVHETLQVQGTVSAFRNKLQHYSVADYDSYKEKMLHYGRLKGIELAEKKKKYNPVTQIVKTALKFFKSYCLKLGFLDGEKGLELCYLQSLYVYETYRSLAKENRT